MPSKKLKSRQAGSRESDAHIPGMRRRAGGAQVAYLGAYLPMALAHRARVQAAREGETLSSLIADALEQRLGATA
jgi:hypothetical protein